MRILLADDERELSRAVSVILRHSGYEVECAYDGAEAIRMAEDGDFDVYILDIMMPEKNGTEVLEYLRSSGVEAPVIMLTAKAELSDKIHGLDAGANDYITKPFAMGELLARIRAVTRSVREPSKMTFGNISLDRDTYEIKGEKSSFRLGNVEYELMRTLIKHRGKGMSCTQLSEKIWDGGADGSEVALYVSYLKKKLGALGSELTIAKGPEGYMLVPAEDAP